jgi:hypothetical protein
MDKRNRPLTWAPVESCRQKHTSVRDIEGSELGPGDRRATKQSVS